MRNRRRLPVFFGRVEGDRRAWFVLAVGCAGFAALAEWIAFLPDRPGAAGGDLSVAAAWIACGVALRSALGRTIPLLFVAVGASWLLGDLTATLLLLHRGPLVQLLLSYPDERPHPGPVWIAIAAAYVDAVVDPGGPEWTLAFAIALASFTLVRCLWASGALRRSRAAPCVVSLTLGVVLATGALTGIDALPAYEVSLVLSASVLLVDLRARRWAQSALTGLVIDLGKGSSTGRLRDALARAVGDPSLVVGYLLGDTGRAVDEIGRPLSLPGAGGERVVTRVEHGGQPLALLIHDRSALAEPVLLEGVTSALAVAVRNTELQADLRSHLQVIELSTRRLVNAAEAERRRLADELRARVEPLLARAGSALVDADCAPELLKRLDVVRGQLARFAEGLDARVLDDAGLEPSLRSLAAQAALPVKVDLALERYPREIERCVWVVCSEALANVIKHAHANQAQIAIAMQGDVLRVELSDDGIGGAKLDAGSGLRRLADRVEAVGGRLSVESDYASGTRVTAEFALEGRP